LYLGRHGQGYHNVAESRYGTKLWDVRVLLAVIPSSPSSFLLSFHFQAQSLIPQNPQLTKVQTVLLGQTRRRRARPLGRCPSNPHRRTTGPGCSRFLEIRTHYSKSPSTTNLLHIPLLPLSPNLLSLLLQPPPPFLLTIHPHRQRTPPRNQRRTHLRSPLPFLHHPQRLPYLHSRAWVARNGYFLDARLPRNPH
jgi:hypothetical protein